jgi:hypothetical protein
MDNILLLQDIELPLSAHTALVIHSNKYTETSAGAFNLPVSSTLNTDIVFRLKDTGEDYKCYVSDVDLPIYTGQEVRIICCGRVVLAYIDEQTGLYHYTSGDFKRKLGLGLPFYWVWIMGITGAALVYFLQKQEASEWIFLPFVISYFLNRLHKWTINRKVEKVIDEYMTRFY